MIMRVESLRAVSQSYARLRRHAGLPPLKGPVEARVGATGPVQVICKGVTYTLWVDGAPATAAR